MGEGGWDKGIHSHANTKTCMPTVSIAEQVINPFLISHLTDVGWLNSTEYLFLFKKHTHMGEGNEIREYTHTPTIIEVHNAKNPKKKKLLYLFVPYNNFLMNK